MTITINAEKLVRDVVVIGASAGGFMATAQLLSELPGDFPAIVGCVLHRGASSSADWSDVLGGKSRLQVMEPKSGQQLEKGVVYVAPADKHMTFEGGHVSLDQSDRRHHTRPAIDPLFYSAAQAYKTRVVGIVLSGAGQDGTHGLQAIAASGGLPLVQAPDEATFSSMPEHALAFDHVRAALTIARLAEVIPRLVRGEAITLARRRR